MIDKEQIEAVILAGGMGRRMGGLDKGLQTFRNAPLALHALLRLQGQVNYVCINANRNLGVYEGFGVPVLCDHLSDYQGPLAGIHAAMSESSAPYILSVPCDVPFFPLDLVEKLHDAFEQDPELELAVASTQGKAQPVFMLAKNHLLNSIEDFLKRGERKIDKWYANHRHALVEFDDPAAFHNVNTLQELAELEKQS